MQLPPEFLQAIASSPGFRRVPFEAVHNAGKQVTSVRLNPSKPILQPDWKLHPVPWCAHGYYLRERPSFILDPLWQAGTYYVQEASSMFLWHVLDRLTGKSTRPIVLDLCAAPGGKTSLLESFFTEGLIVSNEVIRSRSSVLLENMTRWGSARVVVTQNDPAHFRRLENFFDIMVTDVPCSGSGLLRRDPDAIRNWSPDAVNHCSQRQQRILADALPALKKGGLLIYTTCSYSVEEDEQIAAWLVKEMEMEPISIPVPSDWGIVVSEQEKGIPGYRFYPDRLDGEGFFLAVFRKKSGGSDCHIHSAKLQQPGKEEQKIVTDFFAIPEAYSCFKQDAGIRLFPREWLPQLQQLAAGLYIRKAGVEMGCVKGKDFVPSHELALSPVNEGQFNRVTLHLPEAQQYVKRMELQLTGIDKGWNLVCYDHHPLGWVKALPNRINNYFPAEWRVLKSQD
ncbi:MAG TPA: hypothetical protein VG842_07070 [Sediminibacterium sp.]|nr:hypothetical protein [Sediminibacterium sp.]